MTVFFTLLGFGAFILLMVDLGRQENCIDEYEEIINDVESRLDWAKDRPNELPLNMLEQMEQAEQFIAEAKDHWYWKHRRWFEGLRAARKSRKAMNLAQDIYCQAYVVNAVDVNKPWYSSENPA